jgi:urocanate hydratase
LPDVKPYDASAQSRAQKKRYSYTGRKKLAVRNALTVFPSETPCDPGARVLSRTSNVWPHLYVSVYTSDYKMFARAIHEYPHRSLQAAAIMLMIQNNLDPAVAQHPHELITYGGNGGCVSKLGSVSYYHEVPGYHDR